MNTREWVAVHRKHHQGSDTEKDPHSPQIYGIWRVLFGGAFLYARAKKDQQMVQDLGHGTPNDWIEQKIYTAYPLAGVVLMLAINCLLFGSWGIVIWAVQMIWIPFWAAGVVNGMAHWWGYRNTNTSDTSKNLWPCAIWIGGEELHNNHHADGASAKFSQRWWEFDIGWMYIKIFEKLGLAQVRSRTAV